MSSKFDIERVRGHFPALRSGFIYADNAGGSQCTYKVVHSLTDYLLNTNAQLGAEYSVSATSTDRVNQGAIATATLMNASSPDEIIFGPSSTQLAENLARSLEPGIQPSDEIIITSEHEANVGPWVRLASRKGLVVHSWVPTSVLPDEPYAVSHRIETLRPLINKNTRLVAFSGCSNILGEIIDIAAVVKAIREEAAKHGVTKVEVCIDLVAYAPHRQIDVQAWDVDFAFFSYYKLYGPHTSVLYARSTSLADSVQSIAHFFLNHPIKNKLQPGGPGYELTYAASAVLPYLISLGNSVNANEALKEGFSKIAAHEQALMEPLLSYLRSKSARGVKILGLDKPGHNRAPTISFVVVGTRPLKSKTLVHYFDGKGGVGIRYGHFYAYRLVESFGLDPEDGVIRISLVHYNTVAEVERIIEILEEALA